MAVPDKTNVYVRFLELSAAATSTKLPQLDPFEERLFLHLALAQHRGESPAVRAVMALRQFGSPSTNHTRLKSMRGKGWLALADTEDKRRKTVVLTTAARRELRRLSRHASFAAAGVTSP
jgi:DNA-binding MarR family transcriptional regulator